jgi:predicted ATPase/class 3 adenylate cyclase
MDGRMDPEPAPRTLTFLFTDLEGSTQLWERFPEAMRPALARHDAILHTAVERFGGQVVKTTGDGLMAIFPSVSQAVDAGVGAQLQLQYEPWGETGPLRVRMGLHSGEAETRVGDYFGPTVNRAARIMAVGHGGQILLSAATAALVTDQLPAGATLRDLGEHRLKDLGRPEHMFQLVHPGLVAEFPPLATLSNRPNNLPIETSTFVGRETELQEIRERLQDDAVRLLTLAGPGGTGKTRLALRVAADLIDTFDDGAFFVDLSAVRDVDSVLAGIARTIGVTETSGRSLRDDLKDQLRSKRLLLILDNFEQVMSAAPTVVELLSDCPRLKLLVTSREQLHVRGEQVFSVPPLSLPVVVVEHLSAAELARFEAIQLFVDRAQAVSAGFALTDKNAQAIAEICLRLDGLPLAIELATARIRLFSPEALRDRLGSSLRVLGSGARDLPARQQTLRATIDWSYQLLEPGEQWLLQLLSVFSGIGLDAVEAVAGDIDWPNAPTVDSIDGLASLLDKSLIRQADTADGEPRLMMLETIREYAAERLDERADLSEAVHRAHAGYFADFAQRQWRHLTDQRRDPALAAMSANLDNLQHAWRYWVEAQDLDQLNKLVDSLWFVYDTQGWYHATVQLTTDLLDVLSSTPSTPERATQEITLRMSLARALMAIHGYTDEVERAYTSALQLFEGQDLPQLFPVLRSLATFYNFRAELDKGAKVGRKILRLAEQQNDKSMLVDGHLVLGANLVFFGDLHAALEQFDKGIAHFRSQPIRSQRFVLGNNPGVASLTTSAIVLWLLGYPDGAAERADEAVALAMKLEHPFSVAYALFHSGFLHLWRRELQLVRDRAVGALKVAEDHDFQTWRAVATCLLGAAETGLGRPSEGLAHVRQGLALYQGLKTPPIFWPLLLFVNAGAHARAGKAAEALVLTDEAVEIASRGSRMPLLPEFCVLKGDLLLELPTNGDDPERWFQRAYDLAKDLDARMSQLRAAVRLCRVWQERGNPELGASLLRDVYNTFTEGFATTDLIEAQGLLTSPSLRAQ